MTDVGTFDEKLHIWEHFWLQKPHQRLPLNVTSVFTYCIQPIFLNICQVLKLLAITQITTCSFERSRSSL